MLLENSINKTKCKSNNKFINFLAYIFIFIILFHPQGVWKGVLLHRSTSIFFAYFFFVKEDNRLEH